MEEPELRVGGWEKEGSSRWLKRIFSLIMIFTLAFLLVGPSIINYNPAYVPSDSLYLENGIWNGPFDIDYSKEFAGHLKISSVTYESSDGASGKLKIISISSLANLGDVDYQNRIVDKVKEEAKNEQLEIQGNGKILNDENVELPLGFNIYQWESNVIQEDGFFGDFLETVIIKAIVWNEKDQNILENNNLLSQYQTVLCIIFATDGTTINQATELVEDVIKNVLSKM